MKEPQLLTLEGAPQAISSLYLLHGSQHSFPPFPRPKRIPLGEVTPRPFPSGVRALFSLVFLFGQGHIPCFRREIENWIEYIISNPFGSRKEPFLACLQQVFLSNQWIFLFDPL